MSRLRGILMQALVQLRRDGKNEGRGKSQQQCAGDEAPAGYRFAFN
jgi:hypothetical protein